MYLLLLLSFCLPFVVSIDGVEYDKQDFYSKYSMSDWSLASDKQKKSILEDYIKRESAVIEAFSLGFDLDPIVVGQLNNIKKQLLVNFYYDNNVAKPFISELDLSLTYKHLGQDRKIQHLLISHIESDLPQKKDRTKKEAVQLINNIREQLGGVGDNRFDSLVVVYSDDPGASRNLGHLGWLNWGRTPMSFQSSAWGLKVGVLSAPIETQFGYHLVKVLDVQPSQFFYYDSSSYNYETTKRALGSIRETLPVVARDFENNIFEKEVIVNRSGIDSLFLLLTEYKSSLSAGERFVFIDFLKSLDTRLVLFSYNEDYYGFRFFINDILQYNPSRVPEFQNSNDLLGYFKTLILRKVIALKAEEHELGDELFFVKRLKTETSLVLYDFYLKTLVNSVSTPDSLSIEKYYIENRDNKYFVPEKVVVRQIKLKSRELADSLASVVSKENFNVLASSFSVNRKREGGLMDPFERGKFNYLGETAFSLSVGEISDVIENLDKTFSIIMLEKKINKELLPLSRVYKRIESLLLKEGQENIKKNTFDRYLNNKNLKIGAEYEIYFN